MPTTPRLALPYPGLTDAPDIPFDLQQLAERLEAVLAPKWGYLGRVDYTAASTVNATNVVPVPGFNVTVNVPRPNMKLRLTFFGMLKGTAGDRGTLQLQEGATVLQAVQLPAFAGTNTGHQTFASVVLDNPSVGDHTYQVLIGRLSGSGGPVNISAAAGAPAQLLVEGCDA